MMTLLLSPFITLRVSIVFVWIDCLNTNNLSQETAPITVMEFLFLIGGNCCSVMCTSQLDRNTDCNNLFNHVVLKGLVTFETPSGTYKDMVLYSQRPRLFAFCLCFPLKVIV